MMREIRYAPDYENKTGTEIFEFIMFVGRLVDAPKRVTFIGTQDEMVNILSKSGKQSGAFVFHKTNCAFAVETTWEEYNDAE